MKKVNIFSTARRTLMIMSCSDFHGFSIAESSSPCLRFFFSSSSARDFSFSTVFSWIHANFPVLMSCHSTLLSM